MSARGGPFGSGFNQSGGGYYVILESAVAMWGKLNSYSGGSGSGGATTVGSFSLLGSNVSGGSNVSSFFANGRLVKDMGKTIVSAGRTFRKIQAVAPTSANSSPTFGVNGPAAGAVDPGYLTYYVETGVEGAGSGPLLARYA